MELLRNELKGGKSVSEEPRHKTRNKHLPELTIIIIIINITIIIIITSKATNTTREHGVCLAYVELRLGHPYQLLSTHLHTATPV